jgi:hypothetical protein
VVFPGTVTDGRFVGDSHQSHVRDQLHRQCRGMPAWYPHLLDDRPGRQPRAHRVIVPRSGWRRTSGTGSPICCLTARRASAASRRRRRCCRQAW